MLQRSENTTVALTSFLKAYVLEVMDNQSKFTWIKMLCSFYNQMLLYLWYYDFKLEIDDLEDQKRFD
jgi:hypothetical protein